MINRVTRSDTGPTNESLQLTPGILVRTMMGFKQTMLEAVNVASDVFWHGIPLETRPFVTPEIQTAVMKTYNENLTASGGEAIKNKVNAMLAAIVKHYPDQKKNSIPWTRVRAHFFGKIGLWGKTG